MDCGELRVATQNRSGQTIVEFALIVALLLAVLFGIVEFGRAWFYSNHISNSVRASARYGAVLGNASTSVSFAKSKIETYATTEIQSYINVQSGDLTVNAQFFQDGTTTPRTGNLARGDTIEVSATYNFTILTGSIIPYFSGTRPITRTASMRFEG